MDSAVTIVVAAIGGVLTWTASVAATIMWLEQRFQRLELYIRKDMREMELQITKELRDHNEDDDKRFYEQSTRIQRLEINAFGVTRSGS